MTSHITDVRDRIELGFDTLGHWVYRRAWWVLGFTLALVLALLTQLQNVRFEAGLDTMLREGEPARVAYEELRARFGTDKVAIVGIRTEDVFRLDFLAKLQDLHDELEGSVPHLEEITSLVNVRTTRGEDNSLIVEDVLEDWPTDTQSVSRLRDYVLGHPLYPNYVVSPDGRATALLLRPNTYSGLAGGDVFDGFDAETAADGAAYLTQQENGEFVEAILAIVEKQRQPAWDVYVSGGAVMEVNLNTRLAAEMQSFISLSVVAVTLLLLIVFRRFSGIVLPLVVVFASLMSTVAAMGLLDVPMYFSSQILPSFLLAVGVGYSVHLLTLFYRDFDQGMEKEAAVAGALGHSGLAIVMTAVTTAGALASFSAAELVPVAVMGIFAPIGVALGCVLSLLLIPALIAVAPLRRKKLPRASKTLATRFLLGMGRFATRNAWSVLLGTLVLVVVCAAGLPRLHFGHNPISWFPEDDPFRYGFDAVDADFGGALSLEILVDTQVENGLHDPILLKHIETFGRTAEQSRDEFVRVGKAVSISDIVKEINQALNENQDTYYAIPADTELVAQELLLFENSGSDDLEDVTDALFSIARVTLKAGWTDAVNYKGFIDDMTGPLQALVGPEIEVRATGAMVLMSTAFNAVVRSLAESYLIALVVITPLMILLIGNLRLGLASMVPNVAPILIAIGLMGWVGMPLDFITLLIGSIALGLVVDDTIHFMHNFRRYRAQTGNTETAVAKTLETAGRAMFFTSIILSAGFLVYTQSDIQSMSNFGLITAFTIMLAFLMDALVAPALMALLVPDRARLAVAQGGSA